MLVRPSLLNARWTIERAAFFATTLKRKRPVFRLFFVLCNFAANQTLNGTPQAVSTAGVGQRNLPVCYVIVAPDVARCRSFCILQIASEYCRRNLIGGDDTFFAWQQLTHLRSTLELPILGKYRQEVVDCLLVQPSTSHIKCTFRGLPLVGQLPPRFGKRHQVLANIVANRINCPTKYIIGCILIQEWNWDALDSCLIEYSHKVQLKETAPPWPRTFLR